MGTAIRSAFPLAFALLLPPQSHAQFLGGFENGFDGWDYIGDVSLQTSSIGLDPTQGQHMAFVTTMCDPTNGQGVLCNSKTEFPYTGTSSPDARFARQFLGLPESDRDFLNSMPPGGSAVGESGALSFRFYVESAGVLSFDWNKIGADPDSAYFSLWSDDGSSRTTDWLVAGLTYPGSFIPSGVDLCSRTYACDARFNVETGWSTKTLSLSDAGWYTIGFALGEAAEGAVPSVLALDNVRFESVAGPVPEPETYMLVVAGLAVVGGAARSKRSGQRTRLPCRDNVGASAQLVAGPASN